MCQPSTSVVMEPGLGSAGALSSSFRRMAFLQHSVPRGGGGADSLLAVMSPSASLSSPPLSPLGSLRRSVFTGLPPGGTTFGGKKGDIQLTSISRLESRTVAPGEAERRAAGRPQRAEAPGNDPVNAAAAAFTAVFLNLV